MISLSDRINSDVEKAFVDSLNEDLRQDVVIKLDRHLSDLELPSFFEIAILRPEALKRLQSERTFNLTKPCKTAFRNAYFSGWSKESKAKFFSSLAIDTCPYCNRNFILNMHKDDKADNDGMLRECQFDHYYSQEKYPFFALSLYNLIPCCAACNSIKSNKQVNAPNPYSDEFDWTDDLRLGYRLGFDGENTKCDEEISEEGADSKIKKEGKLKWKVQFHLNEVERERKDEVNSFLKTLKLWCRYEHHEGIIADVMKRKMIYNDSYQAELYRKYAGTLFSSPTDLKQFLFNRPFSDADLHMQPLSKLRRDIEAQMSGELDDFIPLEDPKKKNISLR